LENLIKYGILISPLEWVGWAPLDPSEWPITTMVICSNISILLSLIAEKVLARGYLGNRFAAGFYATLIVSHFTLPAVMVLNNEGNPLFSALGLIIIVVEGLKLVSYAHVNYWCRCARDEKTVTIFW
jgi:diacylglycerol O-acyltransferase-1